MCLSWLRLSNEEVAALVTLAATAITVLIQRRFGEVKSAVGDVKSTVTEVNAAVGEVIAAVQDKQIPGGKRSTDPS